MNDYTLGVDEFLPTKFFIGHLPEKVERPIYVEIFGIISEIIKCKNYSAIFLTEDSTGTVMCDLFTDKVYLGDHFRVGNRVIIRGEYLYNNYNARNIVKVESLKVIHDPNQEMVLYLELIKDMVLATKREEESKPTIKKVIDKKEKVEETIVYQTEDMISRLLNQRLMKQFYYRMEKADRTAFALIDLKSTPEFINDFNRLGDDAFLGCLHESFKIFKETGILVQSEDSPEYLVNFDLIQSAFEKIYNRMQEVKKQEFTLEEIEIICNAVFSQKHNLVDRELASKMIEGLRIQGALIKGDKPNTYRII